MTFHFTNSIIINDDPFYVYGAGENAERNIILPYYIIMVCTRCHIIMCKYIQDPRYKVS